MIRLAQLASLALEPREREAVLGDLEECGATSGRAFFQVLGLVTRRQLLVWTDWRPWFGVIGIAGISGFYLSLMLGGLMDGIFRQLSTWRRSSVHYDTGVTSFLDVVIHMCFLAAAIFCWTAVSASALRRFSGRAFWFTGLLFYVVICNPQAWAILSGAAIVRGVLHGGLS